MCYIIKLPEIRAALLRTTFRSQIDHKEVNKMNSYELLYIVSNELTDEAKASVVERLNAVVTDNGGTIDGVDKWGTRKLAYPINYKTEGDYSVMTFEADGSVVKEIERISDLSVEVLRRMITVKA